MKINSLSIKRINDLDYYRTFEFGKTNIFFSNDNSVGKTTLLRGLLFSLGFKIPNTKMIDFNKYCFKTVINDDKNNIIVVKREGNNIKINDKEYNCISQFNDIILSIFGIHNLELINNLLGTIYLDQERGWTLLNRGKVIGDNTFNIENFINGINEDDIIDELNERKRHIEFERKNYLLINKVDQNIKDNQDIDISYNNDINEFNNELREKIDIINKNINNLTSRINKIENSKRNNENLINYISSLGLRLKVNDETITIRKENLAYFNEISKIQDIDIDKMKLQLCEMKKEKHKLLAQFHKQEQVGLIDVKSEAQLFRETFKKINFNSDFIKKYIKELNKEKKEINEEINKRKSKFNYTLADVFKKYFHKLNFTNISYSDDLIFTKNIHQFSGTDLNKIIIAAKLSYISVLKKKTNLAFPLFIDAIANGERTYVNNKEILMVIDECFQDQLFLCTINDCGFLKDKHIFNLSKEDDVFKKPNDNTLF